VGDRLVVAALVELIYALITRAVLPLHVDGIALELSITAGRLLSLLIFFLLFRQLVLSKSPQPTRAIHPLAIAAVSLLLMSPVLVGNYALPNVTTQVVFALTSVVVGLREEFLYRGVLQTILESKVGLAQAVLLSNVVFTLCHYGAPSFAGWNIVEIFCAGCILGLLYAATGSLTLVVAVHAVNDAIWSFTPILASPLPRPLGSAILATALILCAMWSLRSNKRFQPTPSPSGLGRG
jgi:membrane protease YdiL (CAAX protease family)